MVESRSRRRRKPLVLSSTKILLDSLLSSSRIGEGNRVVAVENLSGDDVGPSLQLRAGILRFSKDQVDISNSKLAALDDSALIGVSTSLLKRLSVTSGSLVLVKNVETNIERVAQVVVLDAPTNNEQAPSVKLPSSSSSSRVMCVFESYNFPPNDYSSLDEDIAYLSPLLAFNLDLDVLCLNALLRQGNDALASLFETKVDGATCSKTSEDIGIGVRLEPLAQSPRYASHLRVSFVKIPECSSLESLRARSSIEAEARQEMIDSALHDYFKVDRCLAKGDVFSIRICWNCNSVVCIPCNQRSKDGSGNVIYFKVVAMEPSDEVVLRVNHAQTALVLGGSVSSAVPPDLLVDECSDFSPLQGEAVKTLASVLTPPLCPSTVSSKFRVAVLLYGPAGCGKRTVVRYVACRLGLHVVEFSCHNLVASSDRSISVALAQAFNEAQRYSPAIVLLRHFDVFRNLNSHEGSPNDQAGLTSEVASVIREFTDPVFKDETSLYEESWNDDHTVKDTGKISRHRVLLVAAAESCEGLPPTVRRCFSHEIKMGTLTEEQRADMLQRSLQSGCEFLSSICSEETMKDIVGQTSGFMPRDLHALIADAGANFISRSNVKADEVKDKESDSSGVVKAVQHNDELQGAPPLTTGKEYLAKALDRSKKRNASALGTPKIPDVKWEDVGGLEDVKKAILDTVQLPLLHKDLFSSGLRKRSGVLLYGPPGTGKTLLAKAVAKECSLNFLSVKGPELINMYIGESEKNVRDIFQKARSARPCVIFFDELDSLAPARGASGDSGGVMDRVVSQMLAEIDGLNDSTQDLFIIGASNRPDLIDPALLRPGRLDKLLYVGVSSDVSYREGLLKALTRKFTLHQDVSLSSIAKKCPPNFTGADMYALCADAWFHAAKRMLLSSDSNSSPLVDQADSVVIEYSDFIKVLGELAPSLSMAELKKYESLRYQFEGAKK